MEEERERREGRGGKYHIFTNIFLLFVETFS